ncbi:hypothetical protein OIU79_017279 [Salix purpurea]|uniref:Uncharacterized protein n=1 Tax=Salix purpurea TaxID=77065 RepID=A0A9Q0WUM1_SALPP|nr:hypothetical protein OIU79_017279 [Salix purpurea]
MSMSLPGGVICRFLDSKSCPSDYLAGGEVLDFYRGPNYPDEVHGVTELLVPLNLSRFSMRNRLTVLVISVISGAFQAALEVGPLRARRRERSGTRSCKLVAMVLVAVKRWILAIPFRLETKIKRDGKGWNRLDRSGMGWSGLGWAGLGWSVCVLDLGFSWIHVGL